MEGKIKVSAVFNTYSGLPKSIYVIFLARIINAMGNFVYPFLTIFLTAKLGMSKEEAGTIILATSIAGIPGSLIGGKLADHMGRKKIFITCQAVAALCFVPCAFLGNSRMIPYLLIAASLFGGAAGPANGAMVTDLTNQENRKSAYSLLYLGINIGCAVGPMVAGLLYAHYTRWIFLGDAMTTFASLILVSIFVKETIPQGDSIDDGKMEAMGDEKAEEGGLIGALLKRPALVMFTLVSSVYSFVYSQHAFCIPMQVNEVFGQAGPKIFGTLMSVNALVVIFLTTLITSLTRKLRPIFNVMMAGIFYALGFGMLYYIISYPMFVISTIIWTIGEILTVTNTGVYIANHSPITHRGRFNAVLHLISSAGFATGPVIMGNILGSRSARFAWPIAFYLAAGAASMMYLLYLLERKRDG